MLSADSEPQDAAPPSFGTTHTPAPAATSPPQRPALRPRELRLVALAVFVGGLITVALVMARAVPSPEAAAAGPEPMPPSPATHRAASMPPAPAGPVWSSANRTVWLGNARTGVALEVAAENTVGVWMRNVRPALVVRCVDGRTEVFVFTDSPARMEPQTDDHTVTFSFDDGQETTELWPDSADHDALFAPDGAAFARQLILARTMRFGFTPHNAAPAVALFQVVGLQEALAPAARECGWQTHGNAGRH